MNRNLAVHLGDSESPSGTMRYDWDGRREHAAFAYTEHWLTHSERFAIDPALSLVTGFQFHTRRGTGSVLTADG